MNVAREIRNVPISSKSRNVTKLSNAITSHLFQWAVGAETNQPVAQRKWRRQTCSRIASRRWPYAPIFSVKRVVLRRRQPPVCPAGGVLLIEKCYIFGWCICRTVQEKRELFSFFASFFLFSKEKKKRNSLWNRLYMKDDKQINLQTPYKIKLPAYTRKHLNINVTNTGKGNNRRWQATGGQRV